MNRPVEKLEPVNEMHEMHETDIVHSLCHGQGPKEPDGVDRQDQDPRNWSSTRKTLLFIALMSSSLLADG